ncbi:MAG TPA: STAS domain-containing protein [Solirubrobacteraceae bacterium]|jgi:anti-anti-sigma factor
MAGLGNHGAELSIEAQREPGGAPVLALAGELDISSAPSLEAAVEGVVAERPELLVFELSELEFMDSAGIAVLIGASRQVGAVKLRNPSPIVRRVLELTGLVKVLQVEP